MAARHDGGPAYPVSAGTAYEKGMTLRDRIAIEVAPTMYLTLSQELLKKNLVMEEEISIFEVAAESSYEFADAMLKARQA